MNNNTNNNNMSNNTIKVYKYYETLALYHI